MSEVIKLDYRDLGMMSDEALDFFTDEIRDGNSVAISKNDSIDITVTTLKEWDFYLLKEGFRKKPEKKNYRI